MNVPVFSSLAGPGPWAGIDRQAIAHNLAWLRQRLQDTPRPAGAPPPRLWAVVKANAYGHGLENALPALSTAEGLSVGTLEDLARVRRLGWDGPVLLLSTAGVSLQSLRDPALGKLHIVIDAPAALHELEGLPGGLPRAHAWLRYAGHLSGQGFDDTDYADAYRRVQALAQNRLLAAAGHLHHYAASDDPRALALERQAFAHVTDGLPGLRCTGNSAALCSDVPVPIHPAGQWLRCGLLLYGASALPGLTGAELGLRPAMSLHARLLSVRRIAAGQAVGYGDSFRTPRDTCIGVVGIGYGHGVPRNLWRHGHLLAGHHGRLVALAGRVAMDCLTVDLGPQPPEQPGEIMTLWGTTAAGTALPVETVAQSCDTIAAEILTSLTARVPLVAAARGS